MAMDHRNLNAHSQPLCSVCIANYNGVAYLPACLESILAQTCDFNVEIIVHDDASTDASVDFIRDAYPRVNLIASGQNAGFCIGNNRMADLARGRYILLLNNDAELFPDALECLHHEALKGPAVLTLPQFNAATGALIDRGDMLDAFLNPVPNLSAATRDVGMVMGACLWIPKRLWHELGGFPEWFGSIAEDMYLCLAARLRGYPVRCLDRSGYRHWVGASFGGGKAIGARLVTTTGRRALSERNKSFVMVVCMPGPYVQAILPLHVVILLLEGCVLSAVKRDPGLFRDIYWNAVASLWTHRAVLRVNRRRHQARRRVTARRWFGAFHWMPHKLRMLLTYGVPELAETRRR